MTERWPAPNDPVAFESLCADLWGAIWGRTAQRNGRNGQPQAGVDVFGKHGANWIGIQCKQKDHLLGRKLSTEELQAEVQSAYRFVPPLAKFIIATTGPSDVSVQELARKISDDHLQHGLFEVEVWSWADIWSELNRRPELLHAIAHVYWPQIASVANDQRTQKHIADAVETLQSPLLPCGLLLTTRIEASDEDLRRVYAGEDGYRKLPPVLLPYDGRHMFPGWFVDVHCGVIEAAGFYKLERPSYNLLRKAVKHTICSLDRKKLDSLAQSNEPLFSGPHVRIEVSLIHDGPPTFTLEGGPTDNRVIGSCALDNTVLVDHHFPLLRVQPAAASGYGVSSLRGALIRVSVDFCFFVLPSQPARPKQSWPRLHNFELLLGSRRHALTFPSNLLEGQVIRENPSPGMRGDVLSPQIVIDHEITSDCFEKQLINVGNAIR